MNALTEDDLKPPVRFKRRKVAHTKRAHIDSDVPANPRSADAAAAAANETPALSENDHDTEDCTPNLKEIIRNRRRPGDRIREAARKVETPTTNELGPVDAPRPPLYASRFVAQTGEVVDRDDTQMSEYVEARLAEQNYRQYGWPIPIQLQATVFAIAPDLQHTLTETKTETETSSAQDPARRADAPPTINVEYSNRLAAGRGKLHEVDLGPDAMARTKEAWRRLDSGLPAEETPGGKKGRGKYGFQWRKPKRRNSEAERREQMVEAVLKEAKLDYFDDPAPPPNPTTTTTTTTNNNGTTSTPGNTDEAVAERFRAEYLEALQDQRKRRAPNPAKNKNKNGGSGGIGGGIGGVDGTKTSRGPRLGGSKSARAKMHQAEKEAKARAREALLGGK